MNLNQASNEKQKRIAVYSHSDINGIISDAVITNLKFVGKHFDKIIFITNTSSKKILITLLQ